MRYPGNNGWTEFIHTSAYLPIYIHIYIHITCPPWCGKRLNSISRNLDYNAISTFKCRRKAGGNKILSLNCSRVMVTASYIGACWVVIDLERWLRPSWGKQTRLPKLETRENGLVPTYNPPCAMHTFWTLRQVFDYTALAQLCVQLSLSYFYIT